MKNVHNARIQLLKGETKAIAQSGTKAEIRDKCALPNIPIYICDVELDSGIHLREGEVNPINGWGKGGGIQYDLMGQRVGEFKNERLLEDR